METTEQVSTIRSSPAAVPMLRLLFSGEQGIVARPPMSLAQGRLQIGRSVDSPGLSLPHDKRASRLHASLHSESDSVRIVDENSRNGTFLNGKKVERSAVRNGDVLRIGDSLFLLRYENDDLLDAELDGLHGRAPAMRKLRSQIKLVSRSAATVLLLGETGAGKEVASRAIHAESGRQGPFVAINCGAIPETLAESQLFGHVRGAFTGATPSLGMFRSAESGTLLLDELGELPLALQPKLLRVLEDRKVLPVGATQPVSCDVRVVAATNRDLAAAVAAGTFRADLFARLAEFTVVLPPLRERREDILSLLQGFLSLPTARISGDLAERLVLYHWPFNVRELVKLASELKLRGASVPLLDVDLVEGRLSTAPTPPRIVESVDVEPARDTAHGSMASRSFQPDRLPIPSRSDLVSMLEKHHGSVADIARETGRSRAQVYRWLKQNDLNADLYRPTEPTT